MYSNLFRGIVVDTNDPLNQSRIRVRIPQITGDEISGWVIPALVTVAPAVDEIVWVGFEGGDPSYPIYHYTGPAPTPSIIS
jgi:hypothetical protein